MTAAVTVGPAPSLRIVQLAHDPAVTPAASWERLAVWCAIRELPGPDVAGRCTVADHDPAAPGASRLVAVGCPVGPGVTGAGDFTVVDTPGGWCASVALPAGPRELAEVWQPGSGWALQGLRHWSVAGRCWWPVAPGA